MTGSTVSLSGTITHAGADPDRPGRGLIIERTAKGYVHHRFDTPRHATEMRDRYLATGTAIFPASPPERDGFVVFEFVDGKTVEVSYVGCTMEGRMRERVLAGMLGNLRDGLFVADTRDRDDDVREGD